MRSVFCGAMAVIPRAPEEVVNDAPDSNAGQLERYPLMGRRGW